MGIEDDIRDLRTQVSDLAALFLSTLSDQQIAISEMGPDRLTQVIASRTGTSSFHLTSEWSPEGTILVVRGIRSWGKGAPVEVRPVPREVVAYCAKLEALGLVIKVVNPEPSK